MKKKSIIYLTILVILTIIFFTTWYVLETSTINSVQLTIKRVQIQELKISYTKLKLTIEIFNPTNMDISQLYAEYDIYIANSFVGNGNITFNNIAAKSYENSNTSVLLYFTNVAGAVIDAIINQNFDLTIKGKFYTKVLFNLFPISQDFLSKYSYSLK